MKRAGSMVVAALAALLALAPHASAGGSSCLTGTDPEVAADPVEVVAARDAIAVACPCDAYDGSSGWARGAYLRCATEVLEGRILAGTLRPHCRSAVRKLTSASVCGRQATADAVPCVKYSGDGNVSCSIKAPADRCVDRGDDTLEPCTGFTHCIDAADSNGDLLLDERDTGRCKPAPSPTPRPLATPTPRPSATPASTAVAPQPFPTGSNGALLALLVNAYRVAGGKAAIPVTPTLMAVAGAHVEDLLLNPQIITGTCNVHSWSNDGDMWSGCCYDASHSQAACMWDKPSELSSALDYAHYPGNGFEIAFRGGGATPQTVLDAFKGSSAHRAVLLNQGAWAGYDPFPAMGAAMRGEFAVIWFGSAIDPQR